MASYGNVIFDIDTLNIRQRLTINDEKLSPLTQIIAWMLTVAAQFATKVAASEAAVGGRCAFIFWARKVTHGIRLYATASELVLFRDIHIFADTRIFITLRGLSGSSCVNSHYHIYSYGNRS